MSATFLEIPLRPSTAQVAVVPVGGTLYRMRFRWNGAAKCWVIDFADISDRPILSGVPMLTGADLLEQYAYLGIGHLVAATLGDVPIDTVPTFSDLGVEGKLYIVTP